MNFNIVKQFWILKQDIPFTPKLQFSSTNLAILLPWSSTIFYKSDEERTKCAENSDIRFYLVKSLIRYENPTNVSKWSGPICTTYLESIFLISLCTRYLSYQHKWNCSAVLIIILKHHGALNAMALFAHRNSYFLELCNPFLGKISTKKLLHNGN